MTRSHFLKLVVLLTLPLLTVACGDDNDKANDPCGAQFVATCIDNTAQACVDGKIVKTDCKDKTCQAGVCVDEQTLACDDKYKATCEGNTALTCVAGKIVKTDCKDKTCQAGVCEMSSSGTIAEGKACTKDACLGNQIFECVGNVYRAPDSCVTGTTCSIDSSGDVNCLDTCTEADKGKKRKVCGYDYDGHYVVPLICGLDTLNQYVYDEDPNGESVDCPASCSDGQCVKLTKDDGDACDYETFVERCEENRLVYCDERYDWENDVLIDVVTVITCDSSRSCQERNDENYVACVLPCTKGDPIAGFCEYEYDSYTLYTDACIEAKSSSYYYFPKDHTEDCKTCDAKTLTCKK